jgi:hypothetical protein
MSYPTASLSGWSWSGIKTIPDPGSRISYPGSWIPDLLSLISDLGSQIPYPTRATKEKGGKFVVLPLFAATNISKLKIILFLKW